MTMNSIDEKWERIRKGIEEKCYQAAKLCSNFVGNPKWGNDWSCSGRYSAEILNFQDFKVLIEDIEGSENDQHGFSTFTVRQIKIFDDKLLMHVHRKVQGVDEYDGGGYGDSRVEFITDFWHIDRAAYHDRDIVARLESVIVHLQRKS